MGSKTDIRQASEMSEGDGVFVKRLFPIPGFMNYDPFVLWDEFTIRPGNGFPTHPHRGFEAITYLFEGAITHKDNLGNHSTVITGGAQRFTAGNGLSHSEMPATDTPTRGIQLWINLPKRLKAIDPDYQQVDKRNFPEHNIDGGIIRVLVGEDSPLILLTPVSYLDIQLDPDTSYQAKIQQGHRGFIYVLDGNLSIDHQALENGTALFFEKLSQIKIISNSTSRFLFCAGLPHNESIRQYGPYVD